MNAGPAPDHPPVRVVCLGDLMVDVHARLSGPVEIGSDRPAHVSLQGGGSAANTACWLDHIGVPAVVIARVGPDVLGSWSLARLGRELAAGVSIDTKATTGTCIVLVTPDGERTMVPDPGANATLRSEHLDLDLFRAGGHLHVSGYAIFGPSRTAALSALDAARTLGMSVSVGAASAAPLRELGAEAFFALIGRDVLLFTNRAEAQVLTGQDDPLIAATVLGRRVGQAVVTNGPGAAVWSGSDGCVEVAAEPLHDADTTGAGDAFAAGVLAQLRAGADRERALAAGHELAAQACRGPGGRPQRPADHR